MVSADLILEFAVVLTLAFLLMIPRLMVGKMEAGLHRQPRTHQKRRHAHVRSMHRHGGLRHVRHTA